ncbi:MAG: DUF4105 domain-containing protein [Planctomycetaceae bacterium]|jgi:hypothetical protein|nr:DUF4105 domain-containing protein [Planctomycetaceae bacterium]
MGRLEVKYISILPVVLLLAAAGGVFAQQRMPLNYARLSPQSVASPELHKPWNLVTERSADNTGSIYRLVSDEQPPAQRTPPPITDLQTQTQTPSAITLQTQPAKQTPIWSLGKNLVREFRPANDRKWAQNHAVLQTAAVNSNQVTIRNVRYSRYQTEEKYTTDYYDAVFNLDDIRTIDLVMVPFKGMPRVAHVESSFGFADGRHIGMSIEARYEANEKYDPLGAFMRQFELIYVFADERDMIRLGTDVHKNDVFIYRLKFTPEEVRVMFIDAVNRANQLAQQPEFYHPLSNSCVTNLLTHINKARPNAVPKDFKTLAPGLLDRYMYDLKLMELAEPTFSATKEQAKVNRFVEKFGDLEYFSAGIRQNMLR